MVTAPRQIVSVGRSLKEATVTVMSQTCQKLTGTPYVGRDADRILRWVGQWSPHVGWLATDQWIQPSVANGITGDARGADHPISGTPYHGEDQLHEAFSMPQTCNEARSLYRHLPASDFEQRDNAIVSPDPLVVPRVDHRIGDEATSRLGARIARH